jgi:hypothetical protein
MVGEERREMQQAEDEREYNADPAAAEEHFAGKT